eukprot:6554959-Lingulodinium_polyedra.AAC.1
MATDAGYALRGVPAGCTFATYSIQCYCMADIDTFTGGRGSRCPFSSTNSWARWSTTSGSCATTSACSVAPRTNC